MEVMFHNAESEFQKIVESLETSPKTWQNWKCLHIEALDFEDYKKCPDLMAYAEEMIDCCLAEYDGTVFFCGYQDVYLMVRDIDDEYLMEIADELRHALLMKKAADATQSIYNLNSQTFELIFTLCGKGRLFKVAGDTHMPDIPEQAVKRLKRYNSVHKTLPRVLLIEDDQSTRWIVRKALKGICDFATASNLETCQRRIESFKPDLIFLDIELPDGNGITVLDWLSMENMRTEVVMFSSHNTMDNISVAMAAGAKGFIPKPFTKSQLVDHIRNCNIIIH